MQGIKVIKTSGWLIDKTDYLKKTTFSPANTSFNRTRKMIVAESTRYLNYEIVYSGINNKIITLMYREYDKKDFARTAFFQNVSYTLNDNEPTIIRFKDLEIKVFDAGNEGIEFSVTKDDSQS